MVFAALTACGAWQRVGTPEGPEPNAPAQLPQLTDPATVYRGMGLLADGGSIGFIGSVRLVAGPSPDTMLAMVGLSIRNRGFAFRREGSAFVAEYHVEIVFRDSTTTVQRIARDETIRVNSFRETQRVDESVIFQQFVQVPVGQYVVNVSVRDRGGPNASTVEQRLTVPRRRLPAVSMPTAIYRGTPRTDYVDVPDLVLNPRSAVDYGGDTLRFYLESYGMPPGQPLVISVVDVGGRVAWQDTTSIAAGNEVQGRVIHVPPSRLSLGRYDLRLLVGDEVLASAPFLVAFSEQWVVGNFEDIVSLLRHFAPADTLRTLVEATPDERAAGWQAFWRNSDPNPASPENEALDTYFARVQAANERFRDESTAGWLTERGEVLIKLGEPSDVIDLRPGLQGRGRTLQWVYQDLRLVLYFVDDNGFGVFRLDPRSRSDFLRALNRLRRE